MRWASRAAGGPPAPACVPERLSPSGPPSSAVEHRTRLPVRARACAALRTPAGPVCPACPLRVTPIYPLFTSCEEESLLHGSGRRHVVPWPVGRLTERVYWRWAPRVGDGRGVKIEAELDAVASSSPGSCRTIGAARARGLVAAIVLPPRRRRTRMVPMDQRIESYPLLFGPRRSVPLHATESKLNRFN